MHVATELMKAPVELAINAIKQWFHIFDIGRYIMLESTVAN